MGSANSALRGDKNLKTRTPDILTGQATGRTLTTTAATTPRFVKRHFSQAAMNGGATIVSAQIICAEKPDVRSVETVLFGIIDTAPAVISRQLRALVETKDTLDSSKFRAEFAAAVTVIHSNMGAMMSWTPPSEFEQLITTRRLLSNDGIVHSDSWVAAFAKQVSAIRLCHVRQVSKKGVDLYGNRHFDAFLQPESHESYRGRIQAAFDVLSSGNIPLQAREFLQSAIAKTAYTGHRTLRLYFMRPVKDYSNHANSYNFLTATYAKMLRDQVASAARIFYPQYDIQVFDEPVQMLTSTNRTDADSLGRLVKQPLFEIGDVYGKNVIITDDHVNAGAFTSTLISQAEAAGARVVGVAAFSRHPHSADLLLRDSVKRALLTLHPREEIDAVLGRVGLSVDTLTNREGLTLLSILIDGENHDHTALFAETMKEVNGIYSSLLDGIGDTLVDELKKPPKSPGELSAQIDSLFRNGPVR